MVIVGQDPLFNRSDRETRRKRRCRCAIRVPAIYDLRRFAVAGGLMSYG